MRVKKILFRFLSVLCLGISVLSVTSCGEKNPDGGNLSSGSLDDYYTEGLEFTLVEDGESYKVCIGTAMDSHIVIPSSYEGKPVTTIGEYAFANEFLTKNNLEEIDWKL